MSKALYRDLYLLIFNRIEQAKRAEKDWLDLMVETHEDTIAHDDCIKCVKQAHREIEEFTKLLERFETEIEEP